MSATLTGQKTRWVVSTAGAVVIVGALIMLVRLPVVVSLPSASSSIPARKPVVQLANPISTGDEILKEELELRDPRPLFLPTRFNAALPDPRLETGRTF